MDVRRVKFGSLTPIHCAMRASRFAPFCALLVIARHDCRRGGRRRAPTDWDKPLIIVLVGALALIADRYEVQTAAGTIVVATHPAFVLGMVMLGPLPMLVIGELVIFTNRATTKGRLVGNAAIYGGLPRRSASLLARVAREHLGVSRRPRRGSPSPSSSSSS